jgi:GT2 family glycosyltransferase
MVLSENAEGTAADVKSRLLPPTPLEARIERLIEMLPRKRVDVLLVPGNEVQAVDAANGEYRATGSNPWFDMVLGEGARSGGWFYLEASMVRNNGSRVASLCLSAADRAGGTTWPIPTNLRGSVREVLHLPAGISALRWQPTAAPGYFSQSPLLLHSIGWVESVLRRAYRIGAVYGQWRRDGGPSPGRMVWWMVQGGLQRVYRATTDYRVGQGRGNDYGAFVARTERLGRGDLKKMRARVSSLAGRPIVSLIVEIDCPDSSLLRNTVESVLAQINPHWELWLLGSEGLPIEFMTWIQRVMHRDSRVRMQPRAADCTAADEFNRVLGLAQGDFVAKLGQHDLLSEKALFIAAIEFANHPQAEVIYTDHDCVDHAGVRSAPSFKPDWNPDLLLSTDYVAGLALLRRAEVVACGGYRNGFQGAEHYDLLLRIADRKSDSAIRHIAQVLYSVRGLEGAVEPGHTAGRRVLEIHLGSQGAVVVPGPAPGCYRVIHPLPVPAPLVSIIVPTRDRLDILRACIESVVTKTDYPSWELIVVDNQSEERATLAYLANLERRDDRCRVLPYDKPFNYSAINNFAVRHARGQVVVLLNNDVEVITQGWLTELVAHAVRPGVGAVGAKLLYEDETIQHAGVVLGIGGIAGHVHRFLGKDSPGYGHRAVLVQNLSAVTGACLVVRKALYEEVGGLNEVDLVVALNDVDFCLKLAKAGYRNVFTPYAQLYHHESLSRGRDDTPQKHAVFLRESSYMKRVWASWLTRDPAYNPNLTLDYEDCSLNMKVKAATINLTEAQPCT